MALAWVLRDRIVTSVLIGASKPQQILDNIEAANNTDFSGEELDIIEAMLPFYCVQLLVALIKRNSRLLFHVNLIQKMKKTGSSFLLPWTIRYSVNFIEILVMIHLRFAFFIICFACQAPMVLYLRGR